MSTSLFGSQLSSASKLSFRAENAVTKYAAVIAGTAGDQVDMPGAANDEPVGLTTEAADAGASVEVVFHGVAVGIASAAIARGAMVAIAGTSGKLVAITPGTTTADARVVGRAMVAAAADGDQITVWLTNQPVILV